MLEIFIDTAGKFGSKLLGKEISLYRDAHRPQSLKKKVSCKALRLTDMRKVLEFSVELCGLQGESASSSVALALLWPKLPH
jgi:hypothetical protein